MAWYVFDEKVAVQEKKSLILKSSDNEEFMISEPVAFLSETIKKKEEKDPTLSVIHVPVGSSQTRSKVVNYLNKHVEVKSSAIVAKDLVSDEEMNYLFDLCKAFHYLNVKGLRNVEKVIHFLAREKFFVYNGRTFSLNVFVEEFATLGRVWPLTTRTWITLNVASSSTIFFIVSDKKAAVSNIMNFLLSKLFRVRVPFSWIATFSSNTFLPFIEKLRGIDVEAVMISGMLITLQWESIERDICR